MGSQSHVVHSAGGSIPPPWSRARGGRGIRGRPAPLAAMVLDIGYGLGELGVAGV